MDQNTLKRIETLLPAAQPWAKAHIEAINNSGILPAGWTARIVSGNRTWAEQDALYAQGRTKPGNVVTNARGGQSNHNFGIAWDIGIFDASGKYLGESPYYRQVSKIGKDLGLEWGGDWKSIVDTPHYQIKTGLSLAQLRTLFKAGKEIPVPAFNGRTPQPIVNAPVPVQVFDGATKTDIKATLEAGRVWVAVRAFCDQFGGTVKAVDGAKFSLWLHGNPIVVTGKIVNGTGYAKFVDINAVLEWDYTYKNGMLIIHTSE